MRVKSSMISRRKQPPNTSSTLQERNSAVISCFNFWSPSNAEHDASAYLIIASEVLTVRHRSIRRHSSVHRRSVIVVRFLKGKGRFQVIITTGYAEAWRNRRLFRTDWQSRSAGVGRQAVSFANRSEEIEKGV
uniref:Uncharacterized protein n=1 Tax=Cannabis sativa TaxID=3483 RepID=A0A803Q6B6_CANSA